MAQPRVPSQLQWLLLLCTALVALDSAAGRALSWEPSFGVHERTAEERKWKAGLRVVLVLGTGCIAKFDNFEVERQCSEYFDKYSRFSPWEAPEPPCTELPALRPDRLSTEYALGWHLNCDYRMAYTAILRRVEPYLKKIGWDNYVVVEYLSEEEKREVPLADIVIAPQNEFQDDLQSRFPKKKFIVVHTDDQATIHPDLDVDSDQIVGVFMHTSFTNLEENNKESPHFMRHCAWMIPPEKMKQADIWMRDPPISPNGLKKVHTIIPQILRWVYPLDCGGQGGFVILQNHAFGRNRTFTPPLSERSVDIAFIGAVGEAQEILHAPGEHPRESDPGVVWVESMRSKTGVLNHRQKAIDALNKVAHKHNLTIVTEHGKWKYPKFINLLQDTKIFVSPFGIGEFSGKDYEAILAGALLVKPFATKLRSFPNIYDHTYLLETKMDFSDLEEVVMPILSDPKYMQTKGQMIVERGKAHLKAYSEMEHYAQHLDHVMEKIARELYPKTPEL
mmetsp:Transcript_28525/g.80474  ORF Transcript_28525/g.80474 Transcript_28525/m.80474 type:complete len:505 (+) Transcript_28525:450-1964(+)